MSVSDYPYSSTGGALLWRMLLRSLSLWNQFGPCVQLRHLPTTMIHCWFKILLYRCLKSWYSFSNLNLSVNRTHFQSSTVKFRYFLAGLKRWNVLIFWWCCRFGSAGSCFGYIRSRFSDVKNLNWGTIQTTSDLLLSFIPWILKLSALFQVFVTIPETVDVV